MTTQTIKCLLIFPNPESALNEEAGRLLLERYDDYFSHAKLITSIHAPKKSEKKTMNNTHPSPEKTETRPLKKTKFSSEKSINKTKRLKRQKRILKRL